MNEEFETQRLASVAASPEEPALETGPDLESVMHVIWDRLDALQEERRRARRHAATLASVLLAIAVLWTGLPVRDSNGAPVLLRDQSGNVRARFDVDPESGRTTLQLVDTDGKPQAMLGADVAGPMLTFYDKQGAARMRVGLEDGTEAPIVDVVDRASGSQSRVDLVALREARSVPLPPPSPVVRRTVVRGWRPQRSVVTQASVAPPVPARSYAVCAPGTLGCSRYPGGREG